MENEEKNGTFITCLSTGKGTWGTVKSIISKGNFEKVIVITNDFGKEKFQEECDMIVVDTFGEIDDIKAKITKELPEAKFASEVALNIDSGSGKEHMALISALIEKGYGFKFVTIKEDAIITI
ncbi:MAG: hypothetical protein PHT94_01150 [Candidatus Nanoarchaeia archaeon]|nr:hypothetical protein [Candidatus Nanoarchaeia archaeon]